MFVPLIEKPFIWRQI